jgi:hypothetical protein
MLRAFNSHFCHKGSGKMGKQKQIKTTLRAINNNNNNNTLLLLLLSSSSSSYSKCYAVWTGKVTDMSIEHNACTFRVKQSKATLFVPLDPECADIMLRPHYDDLPVTAQQPEGLHRHQKRR